MILPLIEDPHDLVYTLTDLDKGDRFVFRSDPKFVYVSHGDNCYSGGFLADGPWQAHPWLPVLRLLNDITVD